MMLNRYTMDNQPLVTTIRERCRVCYTCVRGCPAKAIRIFEGQAEVIAERCIGCGNCVHVCSQQAKKVLSGIETVEQLLKSDAQVSACIAPSFPAAFAEIDDRTLIGMIRALGFDMVHEVAFGADLVADQYHRLINADHHRQYISANCPAIIEYICRYHTELVDSLAPVVSPMLATTRALKQLYGKTLKTVFIGPCIAKKKEVDPAVGQAEVDAVITFIELQQMLSERGIVPDRVTPGDFDEPRSDMGALFPVSRGMLRATGVDDDLLNGEVIAADGRIDFIEAIREYITGDLKIGLLEVLCCNGCIMGPGIRNELPLFRRRSHVIQYVRSQKPGLPTRQWKAMMKRLSGLDLSRSYLPDNRKLPEPPAAEIETILANMGKYVPNDELNCGACGYDSCREHAVAIYRGLAETEMCLPYAIDQLKRTLQELSASNRELAAVQESLMHSERLASMGQLAAGIAHEINNPLGIVLMYAHLLLEEHNGDDRLKKDMAMIVEQTDRCKTIVAGLLNFARQNKVVRQPVDVGELLNQSLRSVCIPPTVDVKAHHALPNPVIELDAGQITQVFTNLIANACEAMPDGGTLTISVQECDDRIRFSFSDTGIGIRPENRAKIFEPFFTTKPLGKGTGLGLAVAYGIVKMHRGDITFESTPPKDGRAGRTCFQVILPR